MSVYRNMIEAVEHAVFHYQMQNARQVAWFVEWWTGVRNVNVREIEKMIQKVSTQYK